MKNPATSNQVISTILKHDSKVTSYKIALLRAINDVVFAYPGMSVFDKDVAIPLRNLAQQWVAYYWPFVDSEQPIYQGQRAVYPNSDRIRNDISFRPQLTDLWQLWKAENGDTAKPSDGFFLVNEMRIPRNQFKYEPELIIAYEKAVGAIVQALKMPIQHAGPGHWTVFPRPAKYKELGDDVVPVPGTMPNDLCLIIDMELWRTFQELSLWVEALCIHEWCLFTEKTKQEININRGQVYVMLTDRPDNRRPLSWERNHIDILLMEGESFTCPWSEKTIRKGVKYDLDHILPLAVYPTNELWNLVPSDPVFNAHKKRARLPKPETLQKAKPHMEKTYFLYGQEADLATALKEDVAVRFSTVGQLDAYSPTTVTTAVIDFINQVGESRNLARF